MFSMLPLLAQNFNQTSYHVPLVSSPLSSSPLRSSPLSQRDGNSSPPTRRQFPMSSPTTTKINNKPYSKRVAKSNPLVHNREDGREARRKLFLKKVREGSEDKRWDARGGGDEMMRTIWIAEERRRAERQATEASYIPITQEEEELEAYSLNERPLVAAQSKDEEMVDELAQQEEAEIEALISMMDTDRASEHPESYQRPETPYSSDDEEYDHIFIDVIKQESLSHNTQQQTEDTSRSDQDIMDVS